jgi:phenylalanyl-tRNA synthetase beta chain
MPVINLDKEDLERLVGNGFNLEKFKEEIPMIGATVEKEEDGEISVEFFPDRPDLFSVEGVARAYGKFSGIEKEDLVERHRTTGSSDIELTVDPGMPEVRPVIGAAYVRGVTIDDKALISIMNLQEKLHITVGRKRRKVAIGIHDASPLKPPFRYWAARPDEVCFVPLQKDIEWDLDRILKEHEKGTAYAWILEGKERYPIITDSADQVLSFPPIINGELTRVTEETTDIFVDCTGWDLKAVSLAVNIVCSQLIDRGGVVEEVKVVYPDTDSNRELGLYTSKWPDFGWKKTSADLSWTRNWLGSDLSSEDIIDALERMEYGKPGIDGRCITCLIPPWRGDILHQADLAEDIAIGYGFDSFEGEVSTLSTTGSERRLSTISRYIRQTLIGQGFLEVRTISLSNESSQFELLGREEHDHLKLLNPITVDHTMVRMSSIPSLMSLLRANKHRDLPQRLFETADVMIGNRSRNLLGGVSEYSRASFTEIKGFVQRILQDLAIPFLLEPADLGCYIKGRGAALMVELPEGVSDRDTPFPELDKGNMIPLGHFGEIHPRIITENELITPVSAFEMDLDLILELTEI